MRGERKVSGRLSNANGRPSKARAACAHARSTVSASASERATVYRPDSIWKSCCLVIASLSSPKSSEPLPSASARAMTDSTLSSTPSACSSTATSAASSTPLPSASSVSKASRSACSWSSVSAFAGAAGCSVSAEGSGTQSIVMMTFLSRRGALRAHSGLEWLRLSSAAAKKSRRAGGWPRRLLSKTQKSAAEWKPCASTEGGCASTSGDHGIGGSSFRL